MRQRRLECLTGKTLSGKLFEQQGTDMLGKVLIYGGGGGIGSAVARILAQKGHGLHLTVRNERKP